MECKVSQKETRLLMTSCHVEEFRVYYLDSGGLAKLFSMELMCDQISDIRAAVDQAGFRLH